jgi:protein TonB
MPSDLFCDITTPLSSITRSSRSVALVSIAAHAAVLVAVLFFSFTSTGLLPSPRTALAFFDDPRLVQLMDIELPAPPKSIATPRTTPGASPPAPVGQAPLIAPTSIFDEPVAEPVHVVTRPSGLFRVENMPATGSIGDVIGVDRLATPIPQTPVRLHSGIEEPVKLVHVDPQYPVHAQAARVQGVVILEAVIDAEGRVDSVHVLRSIMLLDQPAIAAVRQWRYRPAMLNGAPVPVIVTITVNFKMER